MTSTTSDTVTSTRHRDEPGKPPHIEVARIVEDAHWQHARALIFQYLGWASAATGLDPLTVQPWLADELPHLGEWYSPPRGALGLAWLNGTPAGVIGIAVRSGGWAEMKRLYVMPQARGHRLGEHLVRFAVTAAGELGCSIVRLETVPGLMDHAIALYRRLNFRPAEPFEEDTNLASLLYLECPTRPFSLAPDRRLRP